MFNLLFITPFTLLGVLIGASLYAVGMIIGTILNVCDLIKEHGKSIGIVTVLLLVLLIVFKQLLD